MSQCKAKFCNVKRGQGISAFAIPDPKKNRQLCQQWIHNLWIKNMDIKTYRYSKQNIVFFIILFQNILIYTILNNTYYIHLLYILRERERERGFIQYFSFLITLHIFNYRLCLGYLFGLV